MQANRCLPCARTALHNQATLERRPDYDVLLTLNRGDDFAHRTRSSGANFCQDRIGDSAPNATFVGIIEMLIEV